MADLTTLSKVKSLMGLEVSTHDAVLSTLITEVSTLIEGYCGRSFDAATHLDYFDIVDSITDTVVTSHYPIIEVYSVYDNGTSLSPSVYHVYSDTGKIRLLYDRCFTRGAAGVSVSYYAGYLTVPEDLDLAAQLWVSAMFSRRRAIAYLREKIGDYSYQVPRAMEGPPPEVEVILRRYKRIT
ncbi:MAG: phage head-tail connector protein [Candidatus Thorarchaeota archaeon]